MSKSKTETQKTAPDDSNVLSKADVLKGGKNPYKQVFVPELGGSVMYKPVPARIYLEITEEGLTNREQAIKASNMLADVLINPDGSQMFTIDELLECSLDTINGILMAIVEARRSDQGNVSSETDGGDSPID